MAALAALSAPPAMDYSLFARQDPIGDAIGVVGLIEGTISLGLDVGTFFGDLFAPSSKGSSGPQGASIQVKAGLGDQSQRPGPDGNFGGNINWADCYDYNNQYLGTADGAGTNGNGGVANVVCDQGTPGAQSDYIGIRAGGDAICIAWVSVKQYDGSDSSSGAWTGDVGNYCGVQWYYGNQVAGKYNQTGDLWRPLCAWFDEDHSNGVRFGSMKFNVHAYHEFSNQTVHDDTACRSTIFQVPSDTIDAAPYRPSKAKRGVEVPASGSISTIDDDFDNTFIDTDGVKKIKRRDWIANKLVVSSIDQHKAKELCEHPTSYGPDLIGSDGFFCDMATKTLTPLCSKKNIAGCVKLDKDSQSILKRSEGESKFGLAAREVHRQYSTIDHW